MEDILSEDRHKTDDYDTVLRTIKEFLTEPFTATILPSGNKQKMVCVNWQMGIIGEIEISRYRYY